MKSPGLAVIYASFSMLAACSAAPAQTPASQSAPVVGPEQPATVAPDVKQVLQLLHDRKETLKDFTAKIDYSVEDKTGDITGKRGTVDFIMDPVKGPIFSADFDVNTSDGKLKLKYHTQFIFDGRDLTIKDFGTNNNVKQFIRSTLLPDGSKPGAAATLNGALPLPIGLEVDDVVKNFDVTLVPLKSADTAILKLVPRQKGKFDYAQLQVTVDKRDNVQLPTKIVITGSDSITTITLTDMQINTGKAKMLDSAAPASDGWTPRAGATKP